MKKLLIAFSVIGLVACGGSDPQPDTQPVEQQAKPVEPTGEDLKKCPCGKGDWEQLPPGTEAEESKPQPAPASP